MKNTTRTLKFIKLITTPSINIVIVYTLNLFNAFPYSYYIILKGIESKRPIVTSTVINNEQKLANLRRTFYQWSSFCILTTLIIIK